MSTQQEMGQHLTSLDTRVTGIESSLQQIISLLSGIDVKKGEKETTKCTPDLQLRKDDSGNDGGGGSTSGTGVLSMFQGAKQSKQSKDKAQSSSSRVNQRPHLRS